jgi:Domain of unknown function (DUF4440)
MTAHKDSEKDAQNTSQPSKTARDKLLSDSSLKKVIWETEDDWERARLAGNIELAGSFIAEDYIGGNSSGQSHDKSRFLELAKRDSRKSFQLHKTDRSLAFHGGVALSSGVATLTSTQPKHRYVIRYLRVFAKRDEKWLLVASQSARVHAAISPREVS